MREQVKLLNYVVFAKISSRLSEFLTSSASNNCLYCIYITINIMPRWMNSVYPPVASGSLSPARLSLCFSISNSCLSLFTYPVSRRICRFLWPLWYYSLLAARASIVSLLSRLIFTPIFDTFLSAKKSFSPKGGGSGWPHSAPFSVQYLCLGVR